MNLFKDKEMGSGDIQRERLHSTEPRDTGSMMAAKNVLKTVKQGHRRSNRRAEAGLLCLTGKEVKEKEALETGSGVSPGPAAATHCSPGCKSHRVP